jgi:uncharacterized protein involved in outer membrane biogenesis
MSIWKSPVFYFGVLLLALVSAALFAPFFVQWDGYKPDLQAYGRKLTGRDVTIAGPVQVRLFPWPRLEAQDVRIANSADFGSGDFLSSDKITVRLTLAGLFNGSLDVEAVELEGPQLVVVRDKQGHTNWRMLPDEALAKSGVLKRVKLDQIVIHNGSLWIEDEARNYSGGVSKLEARLSASAIEGPWKLIGRGQFRGEMIDFTFGTGVYDAGQPLKISARAVPQDLSIPAVATEGEWSGTDFKGTMRIDPHESVDQKQSAEGRFRPLKLQADVRANADQVTFGKIKITPADVKDSGTLIEGSGKLELVTPPHMQLTLASPRVNLDTLLGAGSLSQWRDGGILAVANGIFATMPENLVSDVDLSVNVLTSGGDTLNSVTVRGVAEHQAIRINEASAALPGRSSARFDGIVFPGEGAAELGGKLLFESSDFRGFMGWLTPERKAALDASWRGSRGRMVIKSDVDWTQSRFGMQNLQFELDGAPGSGQVALRLGKVSGLDLKLNATRLDLDDLLPQGFSILPNGKALALLDVLAPMFAGQDSAERHLALHADSLQLNGVAAKDVSLDATTSLSGVEIKSLRIGNVDGATLTGDGLVLSSADGPSGNMKFNLAADEPSGFLRLAGLIGQSSLPPWASVLGKTTVTVDVSASHDSQGPTVQVTANGTSGPIAFEGDALVSHLATLANASIDAKARVSSADGSNLARLVGLTVLQPDDAAGEARFAITGEMASPLNLDATIKALDGETTVKGRIVAALPYLGFDGQTAFNASAVAKLQRVFGLPFGDGAIGGLQVTAHVAAVGHELKILDVQGEVLGQRISGNAGFDDKGKLTADISTGALTAKDLLAWGLLDWDGTTVDVTKSFSDPKAARFPMEIYLHPQFLDLGLGAPLNEAVIGYGSTADAVTLSVLQPGPNDQNLEVTLKPLGTSYNVSAHGRLRLDPAKFLAAHDGMIFAGGTLQIDGAVRGEGRSPAATLASLTGKGSYWLSGGVLKRITLDGYAKAIAAAETQEALTAALNALEGGPGTVVGERTGNFTVENGVMTLAPFGPAMTDSAATIKATADLTSGTVQLTTAIDIGARSELPAVTITYAGMPGAMQKRSGTAALAAKLGYQLLAKDMAALEAVQQQQAVVVAQEEAQRKEDEARFVAFQEQREELRKRLRERRIFAVVKAARSQDQQSGLANALQIGDTLNKSDLAARTRINAARRAFAVSP